MAASATCVKYFTAFMSAEHVGRIARTLMANHHRSRLTSKAELCTALSINRRQLEAMLDAVAAYLQEFGLEMEGTEKHDSGLADKFFLRKGAAEDPKRARLEVTEDDKRLFFVFSAIQAENNNLDGSKLEELSSCQYFTETDILGYMKRQKARGYVACKKTDEVVCWGYGWRFYIEYGDAFDIAGYFQSAAGAGAAGPKGSA